MLLLDTCALIWLANGEPLAVGARLKIDAAASRGELFVSAVSAWEIGLVAAKYKRRQVFLPTPQAYFHLAVTRPGIRVIPFSADAALLSSTLPGTIHADPADRMLVATAREMGASIVTRDRKILDYGRLGHVAVIAC